MRVAGLVFATGCFTAPPPPAVPPPPPPSSPEATVQQRVELPAIVPDTLPLHSEWAGRYVCGQGATAVRLTIDAQPTGEATATFEFGALPENPDLPSGAFRMTGGLHRTGDGGLETKLLPVQWIDQPAGYVMVGVTAVTDPAQRVLRGTIDSPSCSGFEVRRRR
jgi:hypothetical protein